MIVAAAPVPTWCSEQMPEVDVDELVAVEREDRARLEALRGRMAQPAASAQRLGLTRGDDLDPEAGQRLEEERLLACGAAQRSRATPRAAASLATM